MSKIAGKISANYGGSSALVAVLRLVMTSNDDVIAEFREFRRELNGKLAALTDAVQQSATTNAVQDTRLAALEGRVEKHSTAPTVAAAASTSASQISTKGQIALTGALTAALVALAKLLESLIR